MTSPVSPNGTHAVICHKTETIFNNTDVDNNPFKASENRIIQLSKTFVDERCRDLQNYDPNEAKKCFSETAKFDDADADPELFEVASDDTYNLRRAIRYKFLIMYMKVLEVCSDREVEQCAKKCLGYIDEAWNCLDTCPDPAERKIITETVELNLKSIEREFLPQRCERAFGST